MNHDQAAKTLEGAAKLVNAVLQSETLDLHELHCQVCNVTRKSSFSEYQFSVELAGVVRKLHKIARELRRGPEEEGNDGHQRSGAEDR